MHHMKMQQRGRKLVNLQKKLQQIKLQKTFSRTAAAHAAPDFFFLQERHVYAGEIGVILTLGSCLIAAATVSKNMSPKLQAHRDADRRGCWENACRHGSVVNFCLRCLKSHLQRERVLV